MGRKTKDSGVDGLLVVDKPPAWTSHDVVAKCRGAFGQRRAGHSGTLDPDATGVLLIGFGQVTKLLSLLTALPKHYVGEVVLGAETSTLDSSGDVLRTYDMAGVTLDEACVAAATFVGDILQVPPMVSAVQVGGVRLHELARQGIEIERAARPVTVHRFEVTGWAAPGVLSIEVRCSSGTYVRTLAADLGNALGGGAHLRNLRREAIGSFTAAEGAAIDDELSSRPLLSPLDALRDYARVDVDEAFAVQIRNGRMVELDATGSGPWAICGPDGALLAVYEHGGARMRPVVVLSR